MSGWNKAIVPNAKIIPENILRMMPAHERARLGRDGLLAEERQAKIDAKNERELQDRIKSLLRQRDICFNQNRMDRATTGREGWPDFTFAIDGRACAIEVKMPGQNPEPEQVKCMAELMRDGWFVRVVRSEDEFLQALLDAENATIEA